MDLDEVIVIATLVAVFGPMLALEHWGARLVGDANGWVRSVGRFLYGYAALFGVVWVAGAIGGSIALGMPELLVVALLFGPWVLWASWRRLQVARLGLSEDQLSVGRLAGRIMVVLAIPLFGLLGGLFLVVGGMLLAERAYVPSLFGIAIGGWLLYGAARLLVTSVRSGLDSALSQFLRPRRQG